MPQRLKVLLLIPHLGGGGAEHVTALLAQNLSRERYDLHLGLVTRPALGADAFPPWVSVHALGASRVRTATIPLLWLILHLRPDVILSGMAHLNFLVLILRPFLPRATCVLARQNATISSALASGDLPTGTRWLYRTCYPRADRVICQTHAMAMDLMNELDMSERHVAVLSNPVDVERLRGSIPKARTHWSGPGPHLLAVGRLSREKGFDLLLKALSIVRLRFPQTDLVIAGAGPQHTALKAQSEALGLTAAVRFAGNIDRPEIFFPGASAFVLSSRHEGLPNALLEAAACGLPIVAVPSSGGVSDLLEHQCGTWLAKQITADALSATLQSALEELRPNQRFEHAFVEQFRIEPAIRAYEGLIDSVRKERIR